MENLLTIINVITILGVILIIVVLFLLIDMMVSFYKEKSENKINSEKIKGVMEVKSEEFNFLLKKIKLKEIEIQFNQEIIEKIVSNNLKEKDIKDIVKNTSHLNEHDIENYKKFVLHIYKREKINNLPIYFNQDDNSKFNNHAKIYINNHFQESIKQKIKNQQIESDVLLVEEEKYMKKIQEELTTLKEDFSKLNQKIKHLKDSLGSYDSNKEKNTFFMFYLSLFCIFFSSSTIVYIYLKTKSLV